VTDLATRSVEIIRAGQAPTGAYVASPAFAPYRYSWFRDGAFVADAMSRAGEVESAERFFDWCAGVIVRHYPDLHARYTLDGEPSDEEWPTFQLDGYGTWLWALRAHAERHGREPGRAEAVELSLRFLADSRRRPTTDWWEEREGIHAATLACVHAGLAAFDHPLAAEVAGEARARAGDRVDASLLCLYEPFRLLDRLSGCQPLSRIEERLVDPAGGVHRHPDDEYYGGGAWVLLTAWHGWVRGDPAALRWIEERATPAGELPEQVPEHLLRPDRYEPWVAKWGPPACPLLWSHAMYLTAAVEIPR
jgi:GH15 family glucan-1,4-alpha-glucosidase